MGGLTRVQDQTTSLEQVEESREVAKDLHLDQEREVLKDQGPPQENQEVEGVVSKVEEVASKVEAAESKEEVVEKQLPALERNCRLASTSARVSMRGSLARVWPAVQSVAPDDLKPNDHLIKSQMISKKIKSFVPLLPPSIQNYQLNRNVNASTDF